MQSVHGIVDHSVTEAFVLIITFCICWCFWPLLLARLDSDTSDAKLLVSTGKAGNVFPSVDVDPDDVSTQADESEEDSSTDSEFEDSCCAAQTTTFSTGALFEHYGLFGASPTAWCQNHGLSCAEDDGDEIDSEEECAPSMGAICSMKANDLFEHYSLFGASPGAWSGSAIDTSLDEREGGDDSDGVLPSAAVLFEHYGLFGASPGTWASKT